MMMEGTDADQTREGSSGEQHAHSDLLAKQEDETTKATKDKPLEDDDDDDDEEEEEEDSSSDDDDEEEEKRQNGHSGAASSSDDEEKKRKGKEKAEEEDGGPEEKVRGGMRLVEEGEEIEEGSSSVVAFLNGFPRVVLRAALRKFVFAKSNRLKATCTHAGLINDHKAGHELFAPVWVEGADGTRRLALRSASGSYWSVHNDGSLSLVTIESPPRETELFTVELLNGGSGIAFKTCLQTYVGLNPKKKKNRKFGRLIASANTAGDHETFYVSIKCGLLLAESDLIVSANKLGQFTTDTRDKLHRWECFLIQATGNCCTIASSYKKYLSAGTGGQIEISTKVKGAQQLFALAPASTSTDWKYYIRTWYNTYLRCEDPNKPHMPFVADAKDEQEATPFQLLPLGVPAEELKMRSQALSSSIKALQTTISKESDEMDSVADKKDEEERQQEREAVRGRSNTTLTKLMESLKKEGRGRSPSSLLRENLLPGEAMLMKIEQIAHLSMGGAELGTMFVTNMHLIYNPQFVYRADSTPPPVEEEDKRNKRKTVSRRRLAKGWKVGLGYIDYIESSQDGNTFKIEIYCKDFNIIQLASLPGNKQAVGICKELLSKLQELCFDKNEYDTAPLLKQALDAQGLPDDGWNLYDPRAELERLGFTEEDKHWRLTDLNKNYELCRTYPTVIAVPAQITDEQLRIVAEYRSRGRLQSVVWRHPENKAVLIRCSQPRRGLKLATCREDEQYVEAVRQISKVYHTDSEPRIQFLDARPRVNAYANQLNGAGTEDMSNYKRCKRKFLGIGNIHVMRSALYKVERLAYIAPEGKKGKASSSDAQIPFEVWLSEREETITWLEFISLILASAKVAVRLLEKGTSIIFHCSDGWDRTAQVSALAELQIDPYYRTKQGFAILVEKEWLSYGHKFKDRIGHKGKGEKDKERSPIFFQFLECVYQLVRQFPSAFEFNERFLLDLHHATYSCIYGTFMFNSEYDRVVEHELPTKTASLWSHMLTQKVYTNPTFDPKSHPGTLDPSLKNIRLWTKAHFPFLELD